jgi:hypothetical protein
MLSFFYSADVWQIKELINIKTQLNRVIGYIFCQFRYLSEWRMLSNSFIRESADKNIPPSFPRKWRLIGSDGFSFLGSGGSGISCFAIFLRKN